MTSWSTTNRTSTSYSSPSKSGEITYLVSESLDAYYIGSAEDEYLVTQDGTTWATVNKS